MKDMPRETERISSGVNFPLKVACHRNSTYAGIAVLAVGVPGSILDPVLPSHAKCSIRSSIRPDPSHANFSIRSSIRSSQTHAEFSIRSSIRSDETHANFRIEAGSKRIEADRKWVQFFDPVDPPIPSIPSILRSGFDPASIRFVPLNY